MTFDGRVVLHRAAESVKKTQKSKPDPVVAKPDFVLGEYLRLRFRGGPSADVVSREPQAAAWERILARLCVGFAAGDLLEETGCEPPHHVCPSLSLSTSG